MWQRARHFLLTLAYYCDYAAWWLRDHGYRMGDPALGDGALREYNIRILKARYEKSKPKRPIYNRTDAT